MRLTTLLVVACFLLANGPLVAQPEEYAPTFPEPIPFNPEEWETNAHVPDIANPDAPKGGELRLALLGWPATLRTEGPNSGLASLSPMHGLVYQTLLTYEEAITGYVPELATHWQISEDKKTFRFRLNPRARWADGREVTADDVVATIEHLKRPDRDDQAMVDYWLEQGSARILDKYTVEIKAYRATWRGFHTMAAGLAIYPAAYIRMDGETYLNEWNWKLPPGTGPYEIKADDVDQEGQTITLTRRTDFWAADDPTMQDVVQGRYNFDRIRFAAVADPELLYQRFLAGEVDVYFVTRAQRWVDEVDQAPPVEHGWVQKRKLYNREPNGFGGYCFNFRKPPLDKREVRQALAHLFNRERLFRDYLYNQYHFLDSYFPGQLYARDGATRILFDPERARQLLAEAGYQDRDAQGYLLDENGVRFPTLTLEYSSPGFTRLHTVFKEELWNEAGIELILKLEDHASVSKSVWDHQFQLYYISWTASRFPDQSAFWHSKYAIEPLTTNLNGFKDPELDGILEAYEVAFNPTERVRLLKQMDEMVFNQHPYALGWYTPYTRILYWDRFGHPAQYVDEYSSNITNLMTYWWYDAKRAARTEANRKAGKPSYPGEAMNQYDPIEQDPWGVKKSAPPEGEAAKKSD